MRFDLSSSLRVLLWLANKVAMAERISRPMVMEIISSISDRPRCEGRPMMMWRKAGERMSAQVRDRNRQGDHAALGIAAIFAASASCSFATGKRGSAVKPLPRDRYQIFSRYAGSQWRNFINAAARADHRANTGATLGFSSAQQRVMPFAQIAVGDCIAGSGAH